MSFYRKYELAKLIDNGETKTFRASEIATGRLVFLHLLSGMDGRRQTSLLQRLRASSRPEVLEMDDSLEAPYVVTEILEPFSGLENWLESPAKPSAARPSPAAPGGLGDAGPKLGSPEAVLAPAPIPSPVAVAPPPSSAPPAPPFGDFTRMFLQAGHVEAEAPQAKLTGDTQPHLPPPVLPPPAKPASEAHDFTRMFLDTDIPSSASPASPASPAAPPPAIPPPPVAAISAGEFTRLFVVGSPANSAPESPPRLQSNAPPAPPPPNAPSDEFARMFGESASPGRPAVQGPLHTPAPVSAEQGEFTRFFQSPIEASPIPVEEIERGQIAPPSPAPHAKPFRGPGEFTVRFGSNAAGAEPAPPAQAPMFTGGDASAIFGGQQQAVANPPAAEGPSEFTRVFKSPPRESGAGVVAPQVNVAPTPPPPAPRTGIPPIVIAILSILFFGCLIAAGYLALKH